MRNIGPGDAINPRQPLQRFVGKLWQVRVIATWHAVMDLLKLRFDQVKIIQQPFGGRGDVLPLVRCARNVVVGLPQRIDIFLDAWRERVSLSPARSLFDGLRCGKTAAVLLKALRSKQLRANQGLGPASVARENFPGVGTQGIEQSRSSRFHTFKRC